MIRTILVDDEQKSINTFKKVINTFIPNLYIAGTATNVGEAYSLIREQKPQLVFLDIEMGPESGFDLLEKFDEVDFHLIFVTGHEEFALKAIKFSALDYIIKPVNVKELKDAINKIKTLGFVRNEGKKVQQMFSNFLTTDRDRHKITLSISDGFEFVEIANILYCRADGSYSHFYLTNGQKLTTSKNLKFYSEVLVEYAFYRIHSATLVNLRYIKKFSKSAGGYVIMENGNELSVSKSRKEGLLELFSLR